MKINVYFDSKGKFLIRLVGGSQNGIDIEGWLKCLHESIFQNDRYQPSNNNVNFNDVNDAFPCIIVIHKSLFRLWVEYLDESKKMIEKILKIYDKLKVSEKKQGLWPVYKTYLDDEKKRVENMQKVLIHHNNNLERHLQQQCSFINNSSIWIRLVDWKKSEIDKAVEELEYFKSIGLYDYGSAKENLEYNIRLQKENYLDSRTQGHGVYVTPQFYGDETEHWRILFEDNKCVQ